MANWLGFLKVCRHYFDGSSVFSVDLNRKIGALGPFEFFTDLAGGILTQYPLMFREDNEQDEDGPTKTIDTNSASSTTETMAQSLSFDVFLSPNSKGKPTVRELSEALINSGLNPG